MESGAAKFLAGNPDEIHLIIGEHSFGNRKCRGDVTRGPAAGAFWFPAGKVAFNTRNLSRDLGLFFSNSSMLTGLWRLFGMENP
jgi:hypothetical protein